MLFVFPRGKKQSHLSLATPSKVAAIIRPIVNPGWNICSSSCLSLSLSALGCSFFFIIHVKGSLERWVRVVCAGVEGVAWGDGGWVERTRGWRGHTLNPWVKMYLLKINNRAAISSCSRWFYNLVSGGREGGREGRDQGQRQEGELLLIQEQNTVWCTTLHAVLSETSRFLFYRVKVGK